MYVDRASVLTRIAALYVDKIANRIFEPYGLSLAQFKILDYLYNKPIGTVTTAELEEHFQMSHSTSVGLLNNLEKDGWISREKNSDSGRSKVISITNKAERFKRDLENAGLRLEEEFGENLTEEETQEYIRLSRKILDMETGKK